MTVVVIGDTLIDEMREESGSVDVPGGSALNVAVGLSILGVPATLISMYADDADGRLLQAHLDAYEVVSLTSPSPRGTGRAISDRTHGEPRYSFNEATVNRSLSFTPEMLAAIADAELVAISGFPFDDQAQVDGLREAVAGATVLLDPNPRAGLLRDPALFAANLELFAPSLRLLKIGQEDAHLLYDETLDEVIVRFVGSTTVLATAGAEGATVYDQGTITSCPIATSTEPIVDTMGAGDATFASVIAQLARDDEPDWSAVLENAMAIAAATCRKHGGTLQLP